MCEPGFQVMILASTRSVPLPSRDARFVAYPANAYATRVLSLPRFEPELKGKTDRHDTHFRDAPLPTRPPVSRMVLPASEGRSASSCFTVIFMSAPTDAFHTPTLVREDAVKSGNVRECKSHVIR